MNTGFGDENDYGGSGGEKVQATNISLTRSSDLSSTCSSKQTFDASSKKFSTCYFALYASSWHQSTIEVLLAVLIVVLNLVVIVKIFRKPFKMKLFDKIIIAHSIVDGITGLVDVPFFHIGRIFGYWPLGRTAALVWASFDNGINSITNLHMLYMTWARFRSIRAPNSYEKETLAKHPLLVCLLVWLGGLLIWTLITFMHGVDEFTTTISFTPPMSPSFVEIVLVFTTWFMPLAAILPLSFYIIVILNRRRRKMAKIKRPLYFSTRSNNLTPTTTVPLNTNSNNNSSGGGGGQAQGENSEIVVVPVASTNQSVDSSSMNLCWQKLKTSCGLFGLGPQARFQIIITSYCLQWFPPCIIALIDPFCSSCIPANVVTLIYWLTFTVCFTDPLVILFLYPNVNASFRANGRNGVANRNNNNTRRPGRLEVQNKTSEFH